ncbi:helix-turn-helix domain-containing protein [Clostridium botulinum]|nr:helix-turn-helix domain-containing protein [Clostridium botulinum]NFI19463.1 helix-turn-helix domain-containing protein [Clostridium botulinum]NFL92594.1 helix-turn-helix domain-containing protein [Clostridium botulinum]NFN52150.1 helix-turn-helix domain-containing protein [Clostridium botulinum]NFO26637.1 helix-turn-helix domain-containing protein [Clostridium botulinum]
MAKDYLKFRNSVKKDLNLSLEESYMLELIFDYYNVSIGYAYPSYEVLMSDLKTKRRAKVSKLLKSLVKKGYISITKAGKKNTYKLLKYLFLDNKHNDSNGNKHIDGEMDFLEVTEEVKKIISLGFTQKQAKSLLQVANEKIDKVISAFNYATSKGAKNIYSYTIAALKGNYAKIKTTKENFVKKLKFNNFEPRSYDYDSLEKKLLGWENSPEHIDEESTFDLKGMLALI